MRTIVLAILLVLATPITGFCPGSLPPVKKPIPSSMGGPPDWGVDWDYYDRDAWRK